MLLSSAVEAEVKSLKTDATSAILSMYICSLHHSRAKSVWWQLFTI